MDYVPLASREDARKRAMRSIEKSKEDKANISLTKSLELLQSDIDSSDSETVKALKMHRAKAIMALENKIDDIPADKLVGAIGELTKTINLVSGKGDGAISIVIINEDKRQAIAQRIMARTIV